MIAVGLVFIWRSLADLPVGTIQNPGPAVMPLALAVLLTAFALWTLIGNGSRSRDGVEDDQPVAPTPGLGHATLILGAIVVAALALETLGYRLTVLALLLFFLGVVERKRIIPSLAVGFAVSFGSHTLLVHVLKVPLPTGPMGI
jgi:hypothetical protein